MSGRLITLRPERMVAGGAALAREECGETAGRVVLVTGAVPGEVVTASIVDERRDMAHAVVVAVDEPSGDRVGPPCPQVALGCGGCDWQHMAPDAQRVHRLAIVEDALRRTGRLMGDLPVRAGPPLPDAAVRTTVRLAVDAAGRLGFRAARSHDVVRTSSCLVAHPLAGELIAGLRLPGASEVTVRVGAATGERAMWWTPAGVAVPDDLPAGLLEGVRLGPDAVVHEVVAGRTLQVSAGSFFQASLAAADALVAVVRRLAGPLLDQLPDGSTVLDAYGGVGLFGATVVPERLRLLAVEGSRAACADAAVNLAGRDAHVLRCSLERWRPERASLVIADPSRSGLGAEVCRRLSETGTPHIVLVACDPVSFARDVRLLGGHGFVLSEAEVLDLFPHTHHVEVVGLLRRGDG